MNFRICIFGLLLGMTAMDLSGQERLHTVQRGETFYSIARTLGIKPEDLMAHNGITDPTRLQAGQRLRIPDSTTADSGMITFYKAVRGDTLYGIAGKFSASVGAIQDANNLQPNYVLKEGDTLRIPVTGIPATASIPAVVAAAPSTETTSTGNTSAGSSSVSNSSVGGLSWPVAAREISYMTGKLNGVVITGTRNEPVTSLTRGTVLSAGPYRGFGRVVIVQVEGGYLYVYGGCESLSVKEGDRVSPGTEIGKLGVDAVSNKPQLFFMVYRSNSPIDPAEAPRA
jgi:murein DD-endopeptidase MepM/ murein hydrolase activator NlpD